METSTSRLPSRTVDEVGRECRGVATRDRSETRIKFIHWKHLGVSPSIQVDSLWIRCYSIMIFLLGDGVMSPSLSLSLSVAWLITWKAFSIKKGESAIRSANSYKWSNNSCSVLKGMLNYLNSANKTQRSWSSYRQRWTDKLSKLLWGWWSLSFASTVKDRISICSGSRLIIVSHLASDEANIHAPRLM